MKDYERIEDVLLGYYKFLTKDGIVPSEDVIDPSFLDSIWDDCFLARITRNNGYRYEYLGTNIIDAYGEDVSEDSVEKLISTSSHETVRKFDEVIKTQEPVFDSGQFTNSSQMLIKYRQVLLPFINSKREVAYIMGGMRWKRF